jgi:hypothetical protein
MRPVKLFDAYIGIVIMSSHKSNNSNQKMVGQFSIIFVLASQYRSHSVPFVNAAHCPRWFLSMGSRRLHSSEVRQGSDISIASGLWAVESKFRKPTGA